MQLSFEEVCETLSTVLSDAGLLQGRIGISESALPLRYGRALDAVAPDASFVPDSSFWPTLVTTLSDYGEEMMSRAVEVADEGLQTAIATCGHGVTEQEVCLAAMHRMASLGAEFLLAGPSTKGMIGSHSEVTSNLNPFVFTANRLERGQMFWYDQITAYNGYYVDCDRTISIGEPSDEQRDVYGTVREMYEVMLSTLEPGVSAARLWEVGYEVAASAGYEEYVNFIHHGHTIGPAVVGQSAAAPDLDDTVPSGSFVNLEPGLFVPEVGSACIENTVRVTDSSVEPLNETDIGIHVV